RTEIRATGTAATTRRWMTVFDTASTAAQVANATPVNVTAGAAGGALLQSPAGNNVVVSGTAPVGTVIAGTVSYVVTAAQTRHVITDLTPSAGYTISVSVAGANHTVSIVPGGSSIASSNGVLSFQANAAGQV